MEAVRALAEEIGPRPPCSKEEERAARWCAARLSEYGFYVAVEDFRSRRAYQPWFAAYLSLSAVAALLIAFMPLAAFVLGAAALVLYARDAEGRPLVRARSSASRNVVARTSEAPRLVVVAHLDTALSSLLFHPRFVGNLRASLVALHAALLFAPLLGAAAWIAEAGAPLPGILWAPSAVLAGYLAVAAALQVAAARRNVAVPGANDNASGVEVLLRLAAARPAGVWFVVTGSEESGMLGIQAFLDAHGHDVAAASFLNLDSVGRGEVGAAWEEGILRAHQADRLLLGAAEAAGAVTFSYRLLPTDTTALLARGRPALSLLALDARGRISNWHRPEDVPADVDPGALARAEVVARSVMTAVLARAAHP